jgi:enoyl-[acyl-carrier protein] reductase II
MSTLLAGAKGRVARLCDLLGAEVPLIQGGMTSVGTARLAAAVSAAGAFGLVSAGRMTPETFDRAIAEALELTDRPLGVNIPISRETEWVEAMLGPALTRPVRFVFTGGGNPAPFAARIRDAGKRLAIVVSNVAQARKAEALGAALVVAEGVEAGGRASREEIGTIALVPAVADAVGIPVVAAGGIADGRGALAALCLGAAGIQMGTRFMSSVESPLHAAAKQALIAASEADTLLIGRRHGMQRRVLRNAAAESVAAREERAGLDEMLQLLSGARSVRGLLEGEVHDGIIACGQSVGAVRSIEPVATIVSGIVAEMKHVLAELSAELGE